MNRADWLKGRELADPDTTVVMHTVGWTRHWLSLIMPGTLRALCGARLPGTAEPGPDSPECARCARRVRTVPRLLTAYGRLWRRQPALSLLAVITLLCASITGLLVAVWLHTELAWIPVGFLDASLLLLASAPDDENGGGS